MGSCSSMPPPPACTLFFEYKKQAKSCVTTTSSIRSSRQLSVSTVDGMLYSWPLFTFNTCLLLQGESIVSAEDTIADLKDSDDLNGIIEITDSSQQLFEEALSHLEQFGIPYRGIRTEFVGCESDSEYLGKLHCLRLAFKHIMNVLENRAWWVDSGRQILSGLMVRSNKDPKNFVNCYNELMDYLGKDQNVSIMAEELEAHNVKCTNFYDIVLDYILIDSFEVIDNFFSFFHFFIFYL